MYGERVYLRPVELSDATLIARWKRDQLVRRMALGPDVEVSCENQEADIRRAVESDAELYLVIVVITAEQPIGYVRVNWMDKDRRFAWLRFALGAERGKGYAKDALRCLLTHLFEGGVHRVDAEVYEFNQRSLGLLQSLGFTWEGAKREAHWDGKRYWEIIVMGLLESDYI